MAVKSKSIIPGEKDLIFNLTKGELITLVQDAVKSAMTTTTSDNEWMTIEQLINWLGYSRNTLYDLTSTNQIPHIKKRKKLYFSRKAIQEWLQSGNN